MPRPKQHPRLFDARSLPCRYPTPNGRFGATPTRWRYSDEELEPLRDFLADVAWAMNEDADYADGSRIGPVRVLMLTAQRWGIELDTRKWPHPRYGQINGQWERMRQANRR
jgi:hypothetical protein